MKRILLLGAGRSSTVLINYLIQQASRHDWLIVVGDVDEELAKKKTGDSPVAETIRFNVLDSAQCDKEIAGCDIVISLLPPKFHYQVAITCLKHNKSLLTASYLSPEIKALERQFAQKRLFVLSEIGLDPGLDHMSAMRTIDKINSNGYKLLDFETFTGGLVAPESDNNPWNYKFTWNTKNVVKAGQGTPVKFIQEGNYKYIPYNKVFRRTEIIEIEGFGKFEGYANRDSLKYIDIYGLQGISTMYRGTLRRPGFCRAWDTFVQLGATDDSYIMEGSENMTHREFINSFLAYNPNDTVELKLMHYLHLDQDSNIMEKLEWLGIFDDTKIGFKNATPAQILEHILLKKWRLSQNDKDMVVMWNKFIYQNEKGKLTNLTTSMVTIGDNTGDTAMAKTVGLPLGIATKLILTEKIKLTGIHIPIIKDIYDPVLNELSEMGITFKENLSNS